MSYCKLIIVGHLTRDPELSYTPKGTAVCKGSVAVNRKWKTEAGEDREEVTFVDWAAWGRMGEVIAQYHKKGYMVMFDGRLKTESWEDKQTKQKRQKNVMIVESFSFMNNDRDSGQSTSRSAAPPAQRQSATPPGDPPLAGDEPPESDDVPF